MTHYTVLVICPKHIKTAYQAQSHVENVLAPYDENLEMEPYIKDLYSDRKLKHRAMIGTYYLRSGDRSQYNVEAVLQRLDSIANMTPEEYFEWEAGDALRDADKNILSTYNPNSRWDWYTHGGRWADFVSLKKAGQNMDDNYIFQMSNFDFDGYREKVILSRNAEYDLVVKDPGMKGKFGYVDTDKMTREEHLNAPIPPFFTTCAVIDEEGEWIENGKTGMFGMTFDQDEPEEVWENKFYDRFIKNLSPETYVALVDCHI